MAMTNKEKLRRLAETGKYSLEELAEETGYAKNTIRGYLGANGISFENNETREMRRKTEFVREVIKHHWEKPNWQIADMLGLTNQTIYWHRKAILEEQGIFDDEDGE